MKYIKSILRYFYSEEERNSNSQLEMDFGCFPPRPLTITKPDADSKFFVVKIHGLGQIYPYIFMLKKLSQIQNIAEVPEALHEQWKGIISAKQQLAIALKNLANVSKTNIGKAVLPIFVILTAPIIIPFAIFKILGLSGRIYRKIPDGKGYFIPLFSDENRVMIKKRASQGEEGEVIVTHEHIHILQHKHAESVFKKSKSDQIFAEDGRDDKLLLYIFERNELEARLHEIVISYYKKTKVLPVTLEGFIVLLAGSSQFGSLIVKTLELDSSKKGAVPIVRYEERSKEIAEQIHMILLVIKDEVMRRKFIVEVLPVMYGKLLRYYGDEKASGDFSAEICRPNLYDAIYSK